MLRPPIRAALLALFALAIQADPSARVLRVTIDGIIEPITTEILASAIQQASREHDAAVLLSLNTPGGLSNAMRDCVHEIVSSPVPVIAFVTPPGGRAASAGFFLLEAGDIAAMASGTNTGAAHPVILGSQMDPVMKEKLENDAAALLRSVTSVRGRNVELAESAVRQSKSFAAKEALDNHLIDLIARDENDLLQKLNGRTITRFDGSQTVLRLSPVTVSGYELTLRQKILSAISDPNIALALIALGMLGIYVEFTSPGLVLPGVVGAICALLGLAALSVMPLNWLGVALIVLGVALFALEMKFASHGVLALGGAVSLLLGSMLLIESPIPEMRIRLSTAVGVALPLALISFLLITLVVRARRSKVVTGSEAMVGQLGVALEDLRPQGKILVRGEYWEARSSRQVGRGARVRVDGISSLTLQVSPVAETDGMESTC